MAKRNPDQRFTIEVTYAAEPMSPAEYDAAIRAIAHLMALVYLRDVNERKQDGRDKDSKAHRSKFSCCPEQGTRGGVAPH